MAAETAGERRFNKCAVTTCGQKAHNAAQDLFIDGPDGPLTQRTLPESAGPGVCWDHGGGYLLVLKMLEAPLRWPLKIIHGDGRREEG